jgi:polar amino acid transport system substrate-binding protein
MNVPPAQNYFFGRIAATLRYSRRVHPVSVARWAALITAMCLLVSGAAAEKPPHRTLVVGSEEDYPPFAIGKSDGDADGFTVQLWKAVAKQVGLDYTIRVRSFRTILDEFKRGEIDVMINLAQSNERRAFSDFSVPHVVVQGAIFVRKNESRIHSEADLAGKSIIVIDGDLAHDYANTNGWRSHLVLVKTAAEGLDLLASGQHDAMLLSKVAGMQTLLLLKIPNVKPLDAKAGFSQKFSFAVRKGDAELLASVNEGLSLAKAKGEYDALYEKWFGVFDRREVTFRDILKYFGPVAVGVSIIFGVILIRQTEREKAAQRLRESEERYRRIVETAEEGVLTVDPQERITFANPKLARMLGYEVAEMLGKRIPDFADKQEHSENFDCFSAGKPRLATQSDFKFRGKAGSALWTFISTSPICDASGADLGTLAMITDITERKCAETALRREKVLSEAATRIGTLIHANLDPAVILQCVVEQGAAALGSDTAAIAEGDASGWRVRNAHGLPPESIGTCLDPKRDRDIMEAIKRVDVVPVSNPSTGSRMTREQVKGRSVLAGPIAIRGKPVGVVFFEYHSVPHVFTAAERNFILQLGLSAGIALENARLFEEQNRAQQELRKAKADLTRTNTDLEHVVAERTAKLQETVAELEHFSYSITHDMRAPLRAMQGFATILNEEISSHLGDEHKEYLNRIGSVAGRMDQLITDALNFSKTVRQELVSERVDLVKLLQGIVDSYPELQPARARITIESDIPHVMANVAGLTQCFANLLGNAVKFVRPDQMPEIRVWAERVSEPEGQPTKNLVTGHKAGFGWVRIWVEDNGVGISRDFQPRVFDMFQRESTVHEGTGIGLALVRKVTERMGGQVGVNSEPGQGSQFWLMLRAA